MTRVTGLRGSGPVGDSGGRAGPAAAAGSSFTIKTQIQQAAAPVTPVDMTGLLSLQDEGGSVRRDRAAHRAGEQTLGSLAALQAALLGGARPDLEALRQIIEGMPRPADPALQAVIGAIRLRARVELARYETL
jgi:hypothetical protein